MLTSTTGSPESAALRYAPAVARYFFDAGTDVACVGIWDASLPPLRNPDPSSAASDGEVLPIETGADGGFGIAVLVEEGFVAPHALRYETVDREFGLNLTSGVALVGGIEDFRRQSPAITSEKDCIRLTPGWYRVRVHLDRTESDAEEALTPEERVEHVAERRRQGVTAVRRRAGADVRLVFDCFRGWCAWLWRCCCGGVVVSLSRIGRRSG